MTTAVAAIVIFGILIFIHELGHFLVAKRAGILVHEFALGFGPKLFGFKRDGTEYALRLVPLGGFVRMAGMDPREEDVERHQSFQYKPLWQRMAVIFAGPFMNFVLAAVLFAAIFMFSGYPVASTTVQDVLPDRPAEDAGIETGDRIVAVDGRQIGSWNELVAEINANEGAPLVFTVERDGVTRDITITPERVDDRVLIGIAPQPVLERVGPVKAVTAGVEYTLRVTALIVTILGQIITNQAPLDVGGPVRIVSEIGLAAEQGVIMLLQLAAFLSINLGLFNLFPIPALDGSRLMFLAWEGITRRPINPEKENMFHLVGFALLLMLIVVITYNDILQLL
ncbi:MAG: RIP metalloprotease RseP [Desulforudis sp.]|jgi:regulator of sigma E protease|nr:RIP metalloprotease RseP [Clostridia bacterium]MDQ7791133.1 RIP metalloprotease RseP [Clostridia bacterium]RJX17824.1 MAG: RIP metalloprotease RseP [Desulforudis sp.]